MSASNKMSLCHSKRTRKCLSVDCLKVPILVVVFACSLKTCHAQFQLNNPWWNPSISYPVNVQHQYPVHTGSQNQFTAQTGTQSYYPPQNVVQQQYPVLSGQFSRPPNHFPLSPKPGNSFGAKPVSPFPSQPWWVSTSSQNSSHFVVLPSPEETSQNQIFGSGEKDQSHKFMNSHQSPSTTVGYVSSNTASYFDRIVVISERLTIRGKKSAPSKPFEMRENFALHRCIVKSM
jgi:hypothetical protein